MSEEKKEVEVKVYLSSLDNVLKFIECFNLSDLFFKLQDCKDVLLARPSKEALDDYIKASSVFFEVNSNLITLADAYLEARLEEIVS